MASNAVVHFEFPADDTKRMSKFYEHAFGWKMQETGPEMGGYVLVQTAETDGKGMVTQPGAINGGFYPRSTDPMSHHPSVVIQVEDLKASITKVKAAGGKTHGEVQTIPGVGEFISIIDTEGNRISMLQPMRR
ncbi:MAG TPA: VOC family protein [Thermoplasmata archaeon]|nr:VOC family protein [Thermoplasmata archaeon]